MIDQYTYINLNRLLRQVGSISFFQGSDPILQPGPNHYLKSYVTPNHLSISVHHFPEITSLDMITKFLRATISKLNQTSKLKSLSLHFRSEESIDSEFLKSLYKYILSSFKNLQKLSILIESKITTIVSSLKILSSLALKLHKNLKEINLIITPILPGEQRYHIRDQDFLKSLKNFNKFPKLFTFKLILPPEVNFIRKRPLDFPFFLRRGIKKLKNLSLHTPRMILFNLLQTSQSKSFEFPKHNRNIKCLDLVLSHATDHPLPNDYDFDLSLHGHFPQLVDLKMTLLGFHINKMKHLTSVTSNLGTNLLYLKNYQIFFKCRESDLQKEFIDITGSFCSDSVNPGQFSLEFFSDEISSQYGAEVLNSLLPDLKLSEIHKLSFKLTQCGPISNENLQELGERIVQNVKELKDLRIQFKQNKPDDGFFARLKRLISDEDFTEKGFRGFIDIIADENNLINMTNVSLKFENYTQITNESIKRLTRMLNLKPNLERIRLDFTLCENISFKVNRLIQNWLSPLKDFKLNLRYEEDIFDV